MLTFWHDTQVQWSGSHSRNSLMQRHDCVAQDFLQLHVIRVRHLQSASQLQNFSQLMHEQFFSLHGPSWLQGWYTFAPSCVRHPRLVTLTTFLVRMGFMSFDNFNCRCTCQRDFETLEVKGKMGTAFVIPLGSFYYESSRRWHRYFSEKQLLTLPASSVPNLPIHLLHSM